MMPSCSYVRRAHRKVAIGDLDIRIEVIQRDLKSKNFKPSTGFKEHSIPWALWETISPEKIFDDTNTKERATDIAIVRYDPEITKEFFIKKDDSFFRILETENLDRRNEWLFLALTHRGVTDKETNHA